MIITQFRLVVASGGREMGVTRRSSRGSVFS